VAYNAVIAIERHPSTLIHPEFLQEILKHSVPVAYNAVIAIERHPCCYDRSVAFGEDSFQSLLSCGFSSTLSIL